MPCKASNSESTLDGKRPVIASKFFTIPWTNFLVGGGIRLGAQSMADALDGTLKRLGTDCVDLYQVHFPFPTFSQKVRSADCLPLATRLQNVPAVVVCRPCRQCCLAVV